MSMSKPDWNNQAVNWRATMPIERPILGVEPSVAKKKAKSEKTHDRIFICYSHKDKRWLGELKVSLKNISRATVLNAWDDTRIPAGVNWREEIERAIREADIAIVLGSRNFMASDFITKSELLPILKAHRRRGLPVLWIAVSYFNHEAARLGEFQALNNPLHPLSDLSRSRRDKEWVEIENRIKQVIKTA